MSHIPGEEGGLSEAAPEVNNQDLLDKPAQKTGNAPEDQVRERV